MSMVFPVRGLRPCREARAFVTNVPNPGMTTLSSRASASPIADRREHSIDRALRLRFGQRDLGGDLGGKLGFLHGEDSRKTRVREHAW